VATILMSLAVIFGVYPAFMFDIMNPSVKLLVDAMGDGYQSAINAADAAVAQLQALR